MVLAVVVAVSIAVDADANVYVGADDDEVLVLDKVMSDDQLNQNGQEIYCLIHVLRNLLDRLNKKKILISIWL